MKIYLASASPRRQELLNQIGVEHTVRVSGADEYTTASAPQNIVEELSIIKAGAVARDVLSEKEKYFCVIGADTIVCCDGEILGKPKDEADAYRMLEKLSGKKHQVYTGVTIYIHNNDSGTVVTFHEKTDVSMNEMSPKEIKSYIATGEPMDKAGAYGIQSRAAAFVSGIEGDFYNVVGLPVARLYKELCKLGVL